MYHSTTINDKFIPLFNRSFQPFSKKQAKITQVFISTYYDIPFIL